MDLSLRVPEPPAAERRRPAPALPLFRDDHEAEDEPLVRMAAPRAPIAVRKTPDAQRLRFPRPLATDDHPEDAVFEFGAEPDLESEPDPVIEIRHSWGLAEPATPVDRAPAPLSDLHDTDASPLGPRLAAALIDFGLLFGDRRGGDPLHLAAHVADAGRLAPDSAARRCWSSCSA